MNLGIPLKENIGDAFRVFQYVPHSLLEAASQTVPMKDPWDQSVDVADFELPKTRALLRLCRLILKSCRKTKKPRQPGASLDAAVWA